MQRGEVSTDFAAFLDPQYRRLQGVKKKRVNLSLCSSN
jgi:hypothetical protein